MKDDHGSCQKCGMDFNGGLIWDHFFNEFQNKGYWLDENGKYLNTRRILNPEEAAAAADKTALSYGATRTSGCWSHRIGISDGDSVYEWKCPNCGDTVARHSRI